MFAVMMPDAISLSQYVEYQRIPTGPDFAPGRTNPDGQAGSDPISTHLAGKLVVVISASGHPSSWQYSAFRITSK
jgi:hypothetical protein